METFKKYYDYLLIPMLFVVTFIGWYFNILTFNVVLFTAIFVVNTFLLKKSQYNIYIPFFIAMSFQTFGNGYTLASQETYSFESISIYLLYIIPLVIMYGTMIYEMIKSKTIKLNHILIGLIVFLATCIPSFIFTVDRFNTLLLTGVYFNAIIIFLYAYSSKNIDKRHFFLLGIIIALMAIMQMLMKLYIGDAAHMIAHEHLLSTGWAFSNNIGQYIVIALPFLVYFAIEQKKYGYVYLGVAILMSLALLLTGSRSGYLGLAIIAPFLVGYVFYFDTRKNRIRNTSIIVPVGIAALAFLFHKGMIQAFWHKLMNVGFSANGRLEVWKKGIEHFLDHPWIGTGIFTHSYYLSYFTSYHNVILDVLTSSGVLGLLGLIVFAVLIVKTIITNMSKYNFCILLSAFSFFLFAMLDTMHTNPVMLMLFFVMLAFIQEKKNTISD